MSLRLMVWIVPALLYVVFFFWYTSFGGPLTQEEVEQYVSAFKERGSEEEGLARIRAFLESDTGNDFIMINVIHMKDTPDLVDGVEAGDSSDDVMAKYMEYMWPALLSRASHPVMFGPSVSNALEVVGIENARVWNRGAAMRYRSRRDMMEITTNPAFSGRHDFKTASLEKTIAYPIEDGLALADPRVLLFFALLSVAGVLNAVVRR
ncbi:hypothetical protein QMT40_003198 [Parvibaculaceae bacterium PLY_AMNH_Bact1]|nr:hypothetical protein QMT40_003198 [Parvibaculaceae bacterium PLY_AMNH_Bact1]